MVAALGTAAGIASAIGGVGSAVDTVSGLFSGGKKKEQYWTPERVRANYEDNAVTNVNTALAKAQGLFSSAQTPADVNAGVAAFNDYLSEMNSRIMANHRNSALGPAGLAEETIRRVFAYRDPIIRQGQQQLEVMKADTLKALGLGTEPDVVRGDDVGAPSYPWGGYAAPVGVDIGGGGSMLPLLIIGGIVAVVFLWK